MSDTDAELPEDVSAAVDSLNWPLEPSSCPPLHLEPLEKMAEIRMKQSIENPAHNDHSCSCAGRCDGVVTDALGTVRRLRRSSDRNDESLARITVALVLLGHGYTDEAHCLVSPLSWPRETSFGYGPPTALQNSETLAVASYAHALVHRREGLHSSEFGMTGFQNADYWTGSALRSGGEETRVPRSFINATVQRLAQDHGPAAIEWYAAASNMAANEWEPRFLTQLCASVLQGEHQELKDFCEQAATAELKILLLHTLQLGGFDVSIQMNAIQR